LACLLLLLLLRLLLLLLVFLRARLARELPCAGGGFAVTATALRPEDGSGQDYHAAQRHGSENSTVRHR